MSLALVWHTPETLKVFCMVSTSLFSPCVSTKVSRERGVLMQACFIPQSECSHAFVLHIAILMYHPSGLMLGPTAEIFDRTYLYTPLTLAPRNYRRYTITNESGLCEVF